MRNRRVLVCGASIAGPSIAYWLDRYGFDVTVVERAANLRQGGFAVDFRGQPHLCVLEKMGVLDDVRAAQTHLAGLRFVNAGGREEFSLPASFLSGDVEIERGELSAILHGRTRDRVEYVFGDSVGALHDTGSDVEVAFCSGRQARFDLVLGADGLHSGVRRLVFGDESRFLRYGGYHVAGGFEVPNDGGIDHLTLAHTRPGRTLSLTSHRRPEVASALFVWQAAQPHIDAGDLDARKRIVAERFSGLGWETPRVLAAMAQADSMYFDSISQIRMDRVSHGRVALLGDAGYGATMGGLGTGLAVVSAYLLAGELARAGGDHTEAFARYETGIRTYARGCQKVADGAGPFLAPRTRRGMWIRRHAHRLLTHGPMARWLDRMTVKAAAAIELDDYPALLTETG